MNGDNNHHTGFSPQTPDIGSKGWQRVILRGCGGSTDYWGEFSCDHDYGWPCEECPIGIEAMEAEQDKWEQVHQGPPRPPHTSALKERYGLLPLVRN